MSGQKLSAYCGFLNDYYELLATGRYEAADELADDMDLYWEGLTDEEREVARQHTYQLAERYMS